MACSPGWNGSVAGRSPGSLDLTMPSQSEQLRQIEKKQRLRTIGNWCLGLGAGGLLLAVSAAGLGGTNNPEVWTSLYAAMSRDGLLRWLVVPLAAAGFALIVGGACAHGLASRGSGDV